MRLLLAVLGLLLVVLAALLFLDARGGPSPVAGGGSIPAQQRSADLANPGELYSADRMPAQIDAPSSSSSVAAEAIPSADELRGLVVDESGEPIEGAAVVIARDVLSDLPMMPRDDSAPGSKTVHELATDASGRFAARVGRGEAHEVVASHAGLVQARITNCFAGMDVTLRLTRGGTISGRVTHEADGSPVAGARVRAWRQGDPEDLFRILEDFDGVADESGEYRTPPLRPGEVLLDVESERCPSRRSKVEVRTGEDVRCDVSLRRGSRVTGTVRDGVSGRRIAGAEVSDNSSFKRVTATDEAGAFVLEGLEGLGRSVLSTRAAGYARRQTRVPPASDAEHVDVEIELELAPGRCAIGRLVDESGSAVAEGSLTAVMVSETNLEYSGARSGVDGRFEIADMQQQARYLLLIQRDGFASAVYVVPIGSGRSPITDLGDITLYAASSIEGVVVNDVDGSPVPDMLVEMWGSNADRGLLVERAGDLEAARLLGSSPGRRIWSNGLVDRRARATDRAGRFAFGSLSAGAYAIDAHTQTPTAELRGELRLLLAAGETREGLRIVVPLRASVSGRVIGLGGRPVDEAHVMLIRADEIPEQPPMVIADQEGEFLFEVVHGKSYHVVAMPPIRRNLSDEQQAAIGAAFVLDIVAPAADLEIRMQPSDAISGLVRDASGMPVAGASVEVRDSVVGRLNWGSTDETGQFKLRVPPRPSVDVKASRVGGSKTVENVPSSSQLVIELPDKP